MTLKETSNLARLCRYIHKKICVQKWDYFVVITGGEGVGKSRGVFLNILDYWYKKVLGQKTAPKDCFAIDLKDFVRLLKEGKPGDFRGLDEAGDKMDTQDYMNKINKMLYQAYTIIREKHYFSCIVLPSIFDLNSRFRKRRVKCLIHCHKRVDNVCNKCKTEFAGEECPKCKSKDYKKGYVQYKIWNRKRLREIFARNVGRAFKSLYVGVPPIAEGIVYEYDGELKEHYNKVKLQKATDTLTLLNKQVAEIENRVVCNHTWVFLAKQHSWRCRACGYLVTKSPFADVEEKPESTHT